MTNDTKTLTWSEAVDQAMEPTDLDAKLGGKRGPFGTGESIIGEDGKIRDFGLVRERAVFAYVTAHEGEQVEINYADPKHVDQRSRVVWRTHGKLTSQFVTVPVFIEEGRVGNFKGLVVGNTVIPVRGVTSIRATGDNSVVVL